MSSSSTPPCDAGRGHLRRALRRITTTFRRADGQDHDFDLDIPLSASPDPAIEDTDQPSHDAPDSGPAEQHDAPLISPEDTAGAITAASDDTTEDFSYLDPSLVGPLRSRNFISGEWTLDRASAHSGRAQRLRSRYGVDIQPPEISHSNQPSVVHRVQRAPRMRVHRRCHQCGIEFGLHKKCRTCGHDICKRCPRSTGRRVEAMLDAERQSTQSTERQQTIEAAPSESMDVVNTSTSSPMIDVVDAVDAGTSEAQKVLDGVGVGAERGPSPRESMVPVSKMPEFDLTISPEPRVKGKQPVIADPDAQVDPETISCNANLDLMITENSTSNPPNFGKRWKGKEPLPSWSQQAEATSKRLSSPHGNLSPTEADEEDGATSGNHAVSGKEQQMNDDDDDDLSGLKLSNQTDSHVHMLAKYARSRASIQFLPISASSGAADYPQPMPDSYIDPSGRRLLFPAVQRVYRKPRQRIRYMCHNCNIPLLHAQTCAKCGHQRCEQCRRRPSVKDRREPDAGYVEAMERRLSSLHQGLTSAGAYARAGAATAVGQ